MKKVLTNQSTINHFQKVAQDVFIENEENAIKLHKELKELYKESISNIENEIAKLYANFSKYGDISLEKANELIKGDEFKEWRYSLKDYLKRIEATQDDDLKLELETLTHRARISRLEALKTKMDVEYALLADNTEKKTKKHLKEVVKNTYRKHIKSFLKINIISKRVSTDLNNDFIEDLLKSSWKNSNYSKRIWKNIDKIGEIAKKSVNSALVEGKSYQNIVNDLKGKYGDIYAHSFDRLVKTETAYINTISEAKAFKDAGVEQYEISAVLDGRTSDICRSQDGEVYELKDLVIGKNAPPFHPRCRSIIVAVTDYDKFFKRKV